MSIQYRHEMRSKAPLAANPDFANRRSSILWLTELLRFGRAFRFYTESWSACGVATKQAFGVRRPSHKGFPRDVRNVRTKDLSSHGHDHSLGIRFGRLQLHVRSYGEQFAPGFLRLTLPPHIQSLFVTPYFKQQQLWLAREQSAARFNPQQLARSP